MKLKARRWKVIWRVLRREARDPEALARGVGLGLFIGFMPSMGIQTVLGFFVAGLVNANRLVTVLGTLVTNPVTAVPFGAVALWLGDFMLPGAHLTGAELTSFDWAKLIDASGRLALAYLTGCLAMSAFFGVAGYAIARIYFRSRAPAISERHRIQ